MAGRFVVLEGPDGAGTTKHSALLVERLSREGGTAMRTYEPTDGPIGTAIRAHLHSGTTTVSAADLQKWFCEDRSWHVEQVIKPALAKGITVVCDRYVHSTIAYGMALGLLRPWLEELNKNFIRPDVALFLLPPYPVLLERMSRRKERDTLERAELQEKVSDCYRRLAEDDPSIIVIDTSGPVEEVAERVYRAAS
jgi:dTMP kinase